jgi:hypothetical protein
MTQALSRGEIRGRRWQTHSCAAVYAFVNTESAPLAKELMLFPNAR